MISAPVVIAGRSSRRYTTSVVRVKGMPGQPGDLLDADAVMAHQAHEGGPSSRGVQPSPAPGALHTRLNNFRTFAASGGGAQMRRGYQPGVLPSFTGQEQVLCLALQ
jgi:hypothetical protein